MNNHKKANILCAISIVCEILSIPIGFITGNGLMGIISNGLGAIGSLMLLAGITLIIYVRVKFPEHQFSKVLLLIYVICGICLFVTWIQIRVACNEWNTVYESCMSCY